MSIEFREGAVCFAGGEQWSLNDGVSDVLFNNLGTYRSFDELLIASDFQLNEMRQGDYIEASELDTEQKYNDAVAVFELFGFAPSIAVKNYKSATTRNLTCVAGELWRGRVAEMQKRKVTYPQLMAIGKLKRAMIERDEANNSEKPNSSDAVNKPSHYQFFEGVEVIEIIASSMTCEQFKGYCLGNRIKYRLRAGNKDKLEQEIAKSDKYVELYDEHKYLCKK